MTTSKGIPSISVSYARTRRTIRSNELGMRPMQERAWEKHGAGSSEDLVAPVRWAVSQTFLCTVSRAARAGSGPSDKGSSVAFGSPARPAGSRRRSGNRPAGTRRALTTKRRTAITSGMVGPDTAFRPYATPVATTRHRGKPRAGRTLVARIIAELRANPQAQRLLLRAAAID